jgi:hypothetical protein
MFQNTFHSSRKRGPARDADRLATSPLQWQLYYLTGYSHRLPKMILNLSNGFSIEELVSLGNDQLDTQLLYFTICLLQSSTRFQERHANHQEVKFY